MPMGRPKADLMLESAERDQLQSMARSRSIPAALRERAQIVLWSAAGEPNSSIAARLGRAQAMVGKWRRRFIERRIMACTTRCGQESRAPLTMNA